MNFFPETVFALGPLFELINCALKRWLVVLFIMVPQVFGLVLSLALLVVIFPANRPHPGHFVACRPASREPVCCFPGDRERP